MVHVEYQAVLFISRARAKSLESHGFTFCRTSPGTSAQAELPLTSDLSLHFIGSSDSITQSNYYKEALIWQPLL